MKFIVFLFLIFLFASISCSDSPNENLSPKSRQAYDFYQKARNGSTTIEVCESYGGKVIVPNDYKTIEHLGQGIFILRQISTNKSFLGVSFMEGGLLVTERICCWEQQ